VFLVPLDRKGPNLRLVWNSDGARPVPAGKYRVKHYDVEKEGAILSASGMKGPTVEVKSGEEIELSMDGSFKLGAVYRHKRVGTCPGDGNGLAVVIIKGGKLIDMTAIVRDESGKELATALMRYG
jgi:hypothetical protein